MVDYDRNYQYDAEPSAAGSTARQRASMAASPRTPHSLRAPEDLVRRFENLAARWREDTRFHSSPKILFEHPAYREIIGMGRPVVPLLLGDLRSEDSLWFTALHAITGESPVPPDDRGDIPRMTEHWLNWGRERGYVDG